MRVLHLSNSDKKGGAAIAAYRLHRGLRDLGIDSQMLVQHKVTDDDTVHGPAGLTGKAITGIRGGLDSIPTYRYSDRESRPFSPAWLPDNVPKKISKYDPDIVHLHWINNGFMQIESISEISTPIIWTLHDMWAFTGGCHYDANCRKYQRECGSCPQLSSRTEDDLSRSQWERKRKTYSNLDIPVVTPSNWLRDRVSESKLMGDMPVEVIPNGIDTKQYRPRERTIGVDRFNLDSKKKYILFGASYETKRKGGDLFAEAVKQLDRTDDVQVITFGNSGLDASQIPIKVHELGYLSDDELKIAYSTADVMVVPSRQEAFGQTVTESLASGTPVVGFDIGGLSDIINHGVSGYLAEPFDTSELSMGIRLVIDRQSPFENISRLARDKCTEQYKIENVSKRYLASYRKL
ncbi:glycosyltransferase family 4 protein [Salarchaeum sp. III]|uniref:glycosyltransferase family 4 protein n=1 Tax=Salarchaeum sp. III TaxID=3107927 RepID=UPI002ED9727B